MQDFQKEKEKIRVMVRINKMDNEKDVSNWYCSDKRIISLNDQKENYSFDRVFPSEYSTKNVYKEGAKDVALSVLSGIHATIFAYGETSSGKTLTMKGITKNAFKDIYDHINKTVSRKFKLRISALEIYYEDVRDLLSEKKALQVLDDPKKGTIVKKLSEVTVDNADHLKKLIKNCEAARQDISRSHQIIRLTVESSPSESSHAVKTYMASLNFVDLAGIEEISEISSSGLKKSSRNFISLRALASVIKKLSDGENHDIPYKDSKLTEILKSSLGGNARTAIICTISPSSSHLDQTRYTLSFGSKGKAVLNTLWVNVHEIEFDWRDRIKFRPVGDQYPGGSCFAFAVCTAAEAKHQIRTKQIVSLSQQDIYTALVKNEQQDRKGQNLENVFEYVTNEGFIHVLFP